MVTGIARPRKCPDDNCDGVLYANRRSGMVVTFKCHVCEKEIDKDYS